MAQTEARQRPLTSIDVSDPRLYQEDCWRPHFAKLRRDDPVHYCEASRFGPQVMWYISGNRDEEKIEHADRFIVDRAKPRQHLSFGAGIHRGVGDRLAEQQLRILWEEILQRDLRFAIMGPPQRLYSNFIRGIRSLPVRIVN